MSLGKTESGLKLNTIRTNFLITSLRKYEEMLVSYGKSYWRSQVGNLTNFVLRLLGWPMLEGEEADCTKSYESYVDMNSEKYLGWSFKRIELPA